MNNELIRAVLNCGTGDLELLDDAKVNFFGVVDNLRFEGNEISMNTIIEEVFKTGKQVIVDAYKALMEDLQKEADTGEMTEGDWEHLQVLKNLNPAEDFTFYINLQDTSFNGVPDKQQTYEELFEQELMECERITGYEIQW
jgi:hypothetical protein